MPRVRHSPIHSDQDASASKPPGVKQYCTVDENFERYIDPISCCRGLYMHVETTVVNVKPTASADWHGQAEVN